MLEISKIKISDDSGEGQIRFHKLAVPKAKEQFIKKMKRHGSKILQVLPKSKKQTGAKDLHKLVTGHKQKPPGLHKVCTADIVQCKKIFTFSLLKESKLGCIKYEPNV